MNAYTRPTLATRAQDAAARAAATAAERMERMRQTRSVQRMANTGARVSLIRADNVRILAAHGVAISYRGRA